MAVKTALYTCTLAAGGDRIGECDIIDRFGSLPGLCNKPSMRDLHCIAVADLPGDLCCSNGSVASRSLPASSDCGLLWCHILMLSARKLLKPSDDANFVALTRKAQEHWSSCLYFSCSDWPVGGAVCQQRYVIAMSRKHSCLGCRWDGFFAVVIHICEHRLQRSRPLWKCGGVCRCCCRHLRRKLWLPYLVCACDRLSQ